MGKTKELYAQTLQQDLTEEYNKIQYNMINYDLMDHMLDKIKSACRLTDDEFFLKTKESHISEARYIFYALCRNNNVGPTDISRYMKSKDHNVTHGTVIYGQKKAFGWAKKDSAISKLLDQHEYSENK